MDGTIQIFEITGVPKTEYAGTVAYSINGCGATTGQYFASTGANHGFSRTRDGRVLTFDAPGGGEGTNQGIRPSTNNQPGDMAGWYVDGSGLNHGFSWKP